MDLFNSKKSKELEQRVDSWSKVFYTWTQRVDRVEAELRRSSLWRDTVDNPPVGILRLSKEMVLDSKFNPFTFILETSKECYVEIKATDISEKIVIEGSPHHKIAGYWFSCKDIFFYPDVKTDGRNEFISKTRTDILKKVEPVKVKKNKKGLV